MHFSNIITIAVLFAGSALAAPGGSIPPKHDKPEKPGPPPPTNVNQQNQCGNGATPYCCNTDRDGKYSTCKALGGSSTCSATTVCCNANNSIQLCLGNVSIL